MRSLLLSLALTGSVACSASGAGEEPIRVATTVYPMEFLAEEVGGDLVEASNVTPPGAEPHDVELSSDQVIQIAEADLVVYVGKGFQPAVEESLDEATGQTLDALALASSPIKDLHLWLDPDFMRSTAQEIALQLGEIDPENRASYEEAASDLSGRLEDLDQTYRSGLRNCETSLIVTAHEAFGQLEGYGLEQRGISGPDPESEPSPQRIAELVDLVRANEVTSIFAETLLPPEAAETIARETGADVAVLDPLESPPENGDYFTAMERNLRTLREALGCR